MDILEFLRETGLEPKRKASSHGGEFSSACPFCKEGDDRFLTWPHRHNNNGEYHGGRFACRVCGKYGDTITFLRLLHGLGYKEACDQLKITPKQRNNSPLPRPATKLLIADDPAAAWKDKAKIFVDWAHKQLMKHSDALNQLRARGFSDKSINTFQLGYNPQDFFRERADWGLAHQIKDDGKARKLWLPGGITIPTFSGVQVIKIKVRRSDWRVGDQWPKYVEVSGSKQTPSIYGDHTLSVALVLESELDALLIQQEAADLAYCVALGGSTKPLDAETDNLLKQTPLVLFLPDFDEAGAVAWNKWEKMFSNIELILVPREKSPGDFFQTGGNLRGWIEASINDIERNGMATKT